MCNGQVIVLELLCCNTPGIIIKLIDQQYFRSCTLDDFGYDVRLCTAWYGQFRNEVTLVIAVE